MSADPNRAKSIFLNAADMASPVEREAYLVDQCREDAALRREVDELLKHHQPAAAFLESPPAINPTGDAAAFSTETHTALPNEQPGTIIGRFKLLEPIGEGGMGTVWMAQQSEPIRRLVAIKLIKPGMDSKQVLARFDAERQALALMDHPNIARVFDAGTTEPNPPTPFPKREGGEDFSSPSPLRGGGRGEGFSSGRPYFVMELVKGVPITKYCDEHHLTPRQRLELFIPVCQAIQHAHQKGIIHRDIKPSNVLVAMYDDRPVPKVIDFGVAKATGQQLTEETLHTNFGAVVGTLEYMSPEQASFNQLDVDTRSDIYSLGVLLYELLAGSPPFTKKELEKAGMLEMLRVIREQEPSKPSTKLSSSDALPSLSASRSTEPSRLAKLVRGELDWIVMKALEKDRDRRYETANAFAMDAQRYLADEQVLACPPSLAYRTKKFVRRYRAGLATAAVVSVCVLLAVVVLVVSLAQIQEALADRTTALQNLGLAQEQANEAHEREKQTLHAAIDQADRDLYYHRIALAEREWTASNDASALRVLNACDPKTRHFWEWRFLHRLCQSELQRLPREHTKAYALSAVPGGRLASAGFETVVIWDTTEGKPARKISVAGATFRKVALSPDGRLVAACGYDSEAYVWDAETGEPAATLRGHSGHVNDVAFNPDGRTIATVGTDKTVKLWDPSTGKEIRTLTGHRLNVMAVTFNQNGRELATGGLDQTVRIWDANSGVSLGTFAGMGGTVVSVAYSPDGKLLAAAAGNTVRVVTRGGLNVSILRGFTRNVIGLAISPDGQSLATADATDMKVWSLATGRMLHTFPIVSFGSGLTVTAVAYSPDGAWLATASGDGMVRLWRPTTGYESRTLHGHSAIVRDLAFHRDSRLLTSGDADGNVKIWDAENARLLHTIEGSPSHGMVAGLAFSPDGQRLALARLPAKRLDGTTVGTGGVSIHDVAGGKEVAALQGLDLKTRNLAFSPDWTRLASATLENSVMVWDMASGAALQTIRLGPYSCRALAFRPDGQKLAGALLADPSDLHPVNKVCAWDAVTGREVLTRNGPEQLPNSMVYSPDGQWLALSGSDNVVRLWDAETGEEVRTFLGHTAAVAQLAFTADSTRLASASLDRTVRLWDLATGRVLLTLRDPGQGVHSLAFSPNGHFLAVGCQDKSVKLYDARPMAEGVTPPAAGAPNSPD